MDMSLHVYRDDNTRAENAFNMQYIDLIISINRINLCIVGKPISTFAFSFNNSIIYAVKYIPFVLC